MSVNITFTNDTKFPLNLSQFSPEIAPSVDIDQSLASVLLPLASTSLVTSDPQFYGTGDETVVIEWTEPTTGTVFGLTVNYPLSIAGFHPGDYGWGYLVSPAPAGTAAGWINRSAGNLDDPNLSSPVTINGINSQFLYSIQPQLTEDVMGFQVSIGTAKQS